MKKHKWREVVCKRSCLTEVRVGVVPCRGNAQVHLAQVRVDGGAFTRERHHPQVPRRLRGTRYDSLWQRRRLGQAGRRVPPTLKSQPKVPSRRQHIGFDPVVSEQKQLGRSQHGGRMVLGAQELVQRL